MASSMSLMQGGCSGKLLDAAAPVAQADGQQLLLAWCPHHHIAHYGPTDEAVADSSLQPTRSPGVSDGVMLSCVLPSSGAPQVRLHQHLLPPAMLLPLLPAAMHGFAAGTTATRMATAADGDGTGATADAGTEAAANVPHHVRVLALIDDPCIRQLDVQVLIHRMQNASDS
jgi:hypothetical protein